MKYLTTTEAAKLWGISANRITILAKKGRISGAIQKGMRWMIPETATKPADGRTSAAKSSKQKDICFRYPLFVNFDEKDYIPQLSEEELVLREGQQAFHACKFNEARQILTPLSKQAENRYVRLSAIYHCLYIAIYDNSPAYEALLWNMNSELLQDFPYKNEMLMLRYGFHADNISYRSVLEEFSVDPEYTYHPSAYYVMLLVSILPIQNGDFSLMSRLRYDTYELLCQQMEREGYYLEAQKLHYLLSVVSQLQNNTNKMEFHIHRGLTLAMEHDLYFTAAFYQRWYSSPTRRVLRSFPPEFADKIQSLGKQFQHKQSIFEESRQKPSYISELTGKEFEYAFLANQNYTNRQIAQIQGVSEKTVSKTYSNIYGKLGVKTKQELIDKINGTHKS